MRQRHLPIEPAETPVDATETARVRAEKRALKRALQERYFFAEVLRRSAIRSLQLEQLFPGIGGQAVEVGAIDPDSQHANQVDMLYVCAIARHIRARRLFEFGTYLGRTTLHLAMGPEVSEVFTLDLDPAVQHPEELGIGAAVQAVHTRGLQGHFFQGHACATRITQLHGDSRTFDYEPYRGSIDFIFVDGGHSYDTVASDSERAFAMLRPGGVIVWHDFAPKGPDVVTFAMEFTQTRPLFWIVDTSLLIHVDGIDPMTHRAPVAVYAREKIKKKTQE